MITKVELSKAIASYERTVAAAIEDAKKVTLPKPIALQFSTRDLSPTGIDNLGKKVPTKGECGQAIYIFRQALTCQTPRSSIVAEFDKAREYQQRYSGKRNLCKPNLGATEGRVLYVGRSGNPRQRFKEHLRPSESGTYSMHLATWTKGIDIQMEFDLFDLAGIDSTVVQVLEDALWDHLKPMLGRRGPR